MIFGLVNKDSGPGFHRIIVPLSLMKDTDVYITNAITEEDFEKRKPDTIFYNRLISDAVLSLKSKYQFKVVVDVDDWWELDPSHILYDYHYSNRNNEHQIKHIRLADAVTTTHERLAEKIYPFNRNVFVVPNAIPKNAPEWFPINKTQSEYKRIFWQGSITHEKDIELLKGPIRRLDKNKFMMVMAGYQPEETWERIAAMYTNGLRMKGVILPGTSVNNYYCNYQFADVCVCPLRRSPFNEMKSNLKVLEAAHSGLPVIASDVHPYSNIKGVLFVRRQKDWFNLMSENDLLFDEAANILKEFVDKNYNFEVINERRKLILS